MGKYDDIKPQKPPFEEKDLRDYSLARGISALAFGDTSLETEISDEVEKTIDKTERGAAHHKRGGELSLYVPFEGLHPSLWPKRAAQEVATLSKGGELKFTGAGPFIDGLRNRLFTQRLGAQLLTGLRDDTQLPRVTTGQTVFWVSESPTADVTGSSMAFDNVKLVPRPGSTTNSFSRKLLAQGVKAIDNILATDIAGVWAVEIDRIAAQGVGSNNEPMGILNAPGTNSVTAGTHGASPVWDHLVDAEFELGLDNAPGMYGLVTTPQARKKLRKTPAVSAASGNPVWGNDGLVLGYPAIATNALPANLTKGTSTTICSAAILGSFEELYIGIWGNALEIIVDPFTKAARGDVVLTSYLMVDVAFRHPTSFTVIKDWLNT